MNDPGDGGIRVVVADPRPDLREAMAAHLRQQRHISVVASADDGASVLLQAERVSADVVVMSVALSGFLSEACMRLPEVASDCRILLLDDDPDEESLLHGIEAGVDGYATNAGGMSSVTEAILTVARGQSVIPPTMLGPLLRRLIQRRRDAAQVSDRLVHLTPREREVLALLVDGLDQQGIAKTLYISPETARTHLQRVLSKLKVHSRAEAIALVTRAGLADRLELMVERSAS